MFRDAVKQALAHQNKMGSVTWQTPVAYENWLQKFCLLAEMLAAVDRGEPPELLNPNMAGLIPPTGIRSGPGW